VSPLIAALISCSPYDPDLGGQPFLCGDREPRCPDGYLCVERVGSDKVCLREEVLADAGGDGSLLCSADTLEPNDTIENPTLVPIPDAGETHMFTAVICPTEDRDIYRFSVDVTGKNVRIEVNYDSVAGQLAVELLNSTGIVIRTGTPTNNDTDKLRADFPNLAQGVYYGRVQGTGFLNNYMIAFTVTANPLTP
jgi:hypothetical protein